LFFDELEQKKKNIRITCAGEGKCRTVLGSP
jgi:hypothetical protein